MSSLTPLVEQVEQRAGAFPETLLVDGGHGSHADIVTTERHGVAVIMPPSERAKSIETLRQESASPEVIAWRERMETAEAKEQYRARASLCELNNAHQKSHHGIGQFLVRGLAKVTCVVLLGALAPNLTQFGAALLR